MLEGFKPTNVKHSKECFVNKNNSQVYMHSIIIASVQLCGYIVAGSLINLLGKKKLLFILGTLGGLCSYCLYFSNTSTITLILTSMYISSSSIGLNVVLSVIVDLFPTTLRTITVQLAMLFGRFGAMGGNLAFPFVLKIGCAAVFGTLGTVMISSAFMTLLLPNTDMQPLQ
ncbi:hypothetical protein WA026_004110 [Henosepilachna vigintioctopunctata]|uniref:Major facilitator superfamily (MFS) profile domain-containing protein n=1 Tax=Henosepilachna vigintioctopunctata TaxID=420089 RepID=A0AAW1UGK0_9CUCU